MAKETVWQRRARKRGAAKADYYPKVDLADEAGADALASVEALATVQVSERDEPVAEAAEIEAPAAELAEVDPPAAELIEAASEAAAPDEEPAAVEALEIAETEPVLEMAEAAPAAAPEAAPVAADAVRLPEFLDLAAATPLAKTLLERRGQPIVIDGSAVHQLGAQCVQVLLSAKRTWNADGVPLSIVNCAPRMIEDLQFLGIESATLISGDFAQ